MEIGLLHAHKFFVILFLVHYVVKLLLFQLKKTEQLAKYTKITKVPEMIISAGFLITGVWMMVNGSIINTLLLVKIACVLAAIPLAVIGFKRNKLVLATLSVILIIAAYGLAEMSRAQKAGGAVDTTAAGSDVIAEGKLVYQNSCVNCHGADGKLGYQSAKDLSTTTLSAEEQKQIIRNGKNYMPPHKKLTDQQVDAVISYVGTFKQPK